MYVCIYILYMYVYIYILYMYVCIYILYMYVCIYILYMYVCIYILYMYVCTYIFQCRELLQLLGLPCLQSDGEAEALCARNVQREITLTQKIKMLKIGLFYIN
jgi:hypothetical protein